MNLSNEILNSGLSFAMEFGENWLNPINDRLKNIFPQLTFDELDNCNSICKKVNKIANQCVYENPIAINGEYQFMNIEQFSSFMKNHFKWISADNMCKLYSQSCYYALK